jgi:DNA-binding protein YbaB
MVGDLVAAAHADAKRQLDQRQAELMQKAAGRWRGCPDARILMAGS